MTSAAGSRSSALRPDSVADHAGIDIEMSPHTFDTVTIDSAAGVPLNATPSVSAHRHTAVLDGDMELAPQSSAQALAVAKSARSRQVTPEYMQNPAVRQVLSNLNKTASVAAIKTAHKSHDVQLERSDKIVDWSLKLLRVADILIIDFSHRISAVASAAVEDLMIGGTHALPALRDLVTIDDFDNAAQIGCKIFENAAQVEPLCAFLSEMSYSEKHPFALNVAPGPEWLPTLRTATAFPDMAPDSALGFLDGLKMVDIMFTTLHQNERSLFCWVFQQLKKLLELALGSVVPWRVQRKLFQAAAKFDVILDQARNLVSQRQEEYEDATREAENQLRDIIVQIRLIPSLLLEFETQTKAIFLRKDDLKAHISALELRVNTGTLDATKISKNPIAIAKFKLGLFDDARKRILRFRGAKANADGNAVILELPGSSSWRCWSRSPSVSIDQHALEEMFSSASQAVNSATDILNLALEQHDAYDQSDVWMVKLNSDRLCSKLKVLSEMTKKLTSENGSRLSTSLSVLGLLIDEVRRIVGSKTISDTQANAGSLDSVDPPLWSVVEPCLPLINFLKLRFPIYSPSFGEPADVQKLRVGLLQLVQRTEDIVNQLEAADALLKQRISHRESLLRAESIPRELQKQMEHLDKKRASMIGRLQLCTTDESKCRELEKFAAVELPQQIADFKHVHNQMSDVEKETRDVCEMYDLGSSFPPVVKELNDAAAALAHLDQHPIYLNCVKKVWKLRNQLSDECAKLTLACNRLPHGLDTFPALMHALQQLISELKTSLSVLQQEQRDMRDVAAHYDFQHSGSPSEIEACIAQAEQELLRAKSEETKSRPVVVVVAAVEQTVLASDAILTVSAPTIAVVVKQKTNNEVSLTGDTGSAPSNTAASGSTNQVNVAGVPMKRSTQNGLLYCGRRLGRDLIPGSDGQCGPNNGPQCADCKAYKPSSAPVAVTSSSVPDAIVAPAAPPPVLMFGSPVSFPLDAHTVSAAQLVISTFVNLGCHIANTSGVSVKAAATAAGSGAALVKFEVSFASQESKLLLSNYGIKELRFTTPGGRDLAEVDVELVPEDAIRPPASIEVYDGLKKDTPVSGTISMEVKFPDGTIMNRSGSYNGLTFPEFNMQGVYALTIKAAGFVDQVQKYVQYKGLKNSERRRRILITHPIASGQFRVVLSWKATPRDLDIFCVTRGPSSSDIHTISHGKKNLNNENGTGVKLDEDVRHGFGPETMTVNVQPGRNYLFYVHNYSNEALLSSSQASVLVTGVPGLTEPIMVPSGSQSADQRYWELFRMVDGRVSLANKIMKETPSL